jgi:hypothetical protein
MKRRPSRVALAWMATFCVVVAGCATRTQTFVVLDGDDVVRGETVTLEVEVRGDDGDVVRTSTFRPGASDPALPFSLALEPRGGDASRRFEVRAVARRADGSALAEARVRSGYVSGRALSLRVYLTTACRDVSCPDPITTCRAGACEDLFVPPETLPTHPDDDVDASTRDVGPTSDAWLAVFDAPLPDAALEIDARTTDDTGAAGDASSTDASSTDAAALDASTRDASTTDAFVPIDAATPDAGSDAGPPPLDPGVLLHVAGDTGSFADIVFVTGDASQVCAAGRLRGGATIAGTHLDPTTSGATGTWVACFDVGPSGTTPRYVRRLEPVGDTLVGAIALDAAGRLYLGVNSDAGGRTFGTTTLTARSVLVRIERDGTISAALALSAPESDEPTQAMLSGSQLYVSSFAAGGSDALVSRFETSAFARVSSLRTLGGYNVALDVGSAGVLVGGYFNPGPADLATVRVLDAALGSTLWTYDSVGSAYVQAVAMSATGHAFVGTRARFGNFQWAGSALVSPGSDGTDAGDIVLTRFAPTGAIEWMTRPIVAAGEDVIGGLDVADDGSLVAVGYSPDLLAPSGLAELAGRTSGREGWVLHARGDSGAPIAWDRINATTDCVVQRMWRTGEWLYVTGLFRGTVQAVVSPAFGGGLTATGMQDAFVVRLRIPS